MDLFSEMPSDPAQFDAYADFYIGRAKDLQKQYENQPTMGDAPEIPHFIALGNRFVELTQNGTSGDLERARQFFCAVSSHPHNYPDDKRWAEV
ncbi:MAG TPA: hypothetical protein PLZ51_08640, partial [Aggregatilineales bacterium]|nr:hypothetical protein [Aggregatilineales bacterium]